ncbi:NADP-dependent oxidoreductase [Corynebacterium halotolerans]|uniref:NADP-dependent oxidoreductase n=1 Tax=Corynebacterium halotolerans TaxID=225326 RepID=UPI003CE967E2
MSETNQTISTQIELASRPRGLPTPDNFRRVTVELPELADGEVRVRNEFISVDPYMRGRMSGAKSYVAPFELGETMTGGAVGTVIASRSDDLPVGTLVTSMHGWRDITQGPAGDFAVQPDLGGVPHSLYLGLLGMPGLTAYVGLTKIAGINEGDVVFVSGAAGAVGSTVGQIARLCGASRVIGSAGGEEKTALLEEKYGFDAALNYKKGTLRQQLAHAAPEGIDVYFDNVGGDHLEAALDVLKRYGRVAVCGAVSQYNDEDPQPGPDNLGQIVKKSLRLQGFIVGDYQEYAEEFRPKMSEWFNNGQIVWDETVVEGLPNAPDAFISQLQGGNTGKMVVKI